MQKVIFLVDMNAFFISWEMTRNHSCRKHQQGNIPGWLQSLEQNWCRFHSVRLVEISLSGFHEESSSDQLSLFNQMEDPVKNDKKERIDKAVDKIRNKHGSEKITFAALVKK
jgi:hypothetical protein